MRCQEKTALLSEGAPQSGIPVLARGEIIADVSYKNTVARIAAKTGREQAGLSALFGGEYKKGDPKDRKLRDAKRD